MNYFKIFPNCKIVLGYKNASVNDLGRNKTELLPLDFAKLLLALDNKTTIKEALSKFNNSDREAINHNLKYMVDNDYGIFCSEELFSCFPEMSSEFLEPNEISNSIIELKSTQISKLNNSLLQLENLGCFDISIILYEKITKKIFLKLLEQIPSNRIKSVEIISQWHKEVNDSFFKKLNNSNFQIVTLTFFSAPYDKVEIKDKDILFERQFVSKSITDFSHCGKVNLKYFNTNITKVSEAIHHNSCLHKKIAIDKDGNIRNCPSMPQRFGNIKDTSLEEALNHKDFKKYWNLTKDSIEVCKDCEFRYICTDCRAYTERTHENKEGLDISKPLKCGYNPYTGEWEEWSKNPLKEKAIKYYGMQELVKK